MRSNLPALLALFILIFGATSAAAESASGLPTGKRQHKPVTISKNWSAYRAPAQRLTDARQRRAALKLVDALEQAKRGHASDKSHRLHRGRKSRTAQRNQTDLGFLRGRARRSAKGGGDVAMEELVLSTEGLSLVKSKYNRLRGALGTRTDCVRACDAMKRRCEARCRKRSSCACVVTASDCLLAKIRARRCSTAAMRGRPAKVKGRTLKSDDGR